MNIKTTLWLLAFVIFAFNIIGLFGLPSVMADVIVTQQSQSLSSFILISVIVVDLLVIYFAFRWYKKRLR